MKIKRTLFFRKNWLLVKIVVFVLFAGTGFYQASTKTNQVRAAAPLSGKNLTTAAFSRPAAPLACPAGTSTVTFDWSSSLGSGNEWLSSYDTDGVSQIYSVPYTDIGGSPNTVAVTVTINDPANRSCDDNLNNPWGTTPNPWTSDTGCEDSVTTTETNGIFGAGFLSVFMKSVSTDDVMGFEFDFSKPVYMDDFQVSDVDYAGFITSGTSEPGQSYQDVVMLSATDATGGDVPVAVTGGSAVTVIGQTTAANYQTNGNGNLAETDPNGTITASTNQPFTSFNFSYNNGPLDALDEQTYPAAYSWWSGTNGATNGASDSHAVRMSGFTFCVQDTAALEVEKSVNPTTPVALGETLTYSIVVNNTGDVNQTDIVITDALPTGVTYVSGSAQKTYWDSAVSSGIFVHDMGAGTFDTPGLTQSYTVTSADVPAGATLSSYGLTTTGFSNDWLSDISLNATYPSGTAYLMTPGDFGGAGPGSWNLSRGPGAFGGPAEGTYQFIWDDSFNGVGGDDNSITTAVFTINYTYLGSRAETTDAANAPPNLVTAVDGIDLQPGEAMTVTFQVTVNDPLDSSITELLNTASVTSAQQFVPITDSAINLISGVDHDFGDLPATYNNTLLNPDNGARHVIGSLFLGAAVDAETDGQESSDGSGDGSDDDGLIRDAADLWTPGATVNIDASVTGSNGYLGGWFDWNGDGDFDDAGEFVDFGAVSGTQSLNLTISNEYTTSDPVSARFRLFDSAALPGGSLDAGDYVGSASNGEVEDYVWAYGPTAVSLQDIQAATNSPLLIASVIGFVMLAMVSISLYRFQPAMIRKK